MNIWPSLIHSLTQTFRGETLPKQLELQIGEVVRATLIEMVDDHSALIQIKGQTLLAQVETRLPKGATIPLVIIGQSASGQLEMKRLPTEQAVKAAMSGTAAVNTDLQAGVSTAGQQLPVESLIRSLGLKETPVSQMAVNSLLAAQRSVSANLIKLIESIVEQETQTHLAQLTQSADRLTPEQIKAETNNVQKAAIELLVQMVKKDIPIQHATYLAMKTLWNGPPLQKILADIGSPTSGELNPLQAKSPTLENPSINPLFVAREPFPAVRDHYSQFPNFYGYALQLDQLHSVSIEERGLLVQTAAKRLGLAYEVQLERVMQTVQPDATALSDNLKARLLTVLQGANGTAPISSDVNLQAVEQALLHLTGQQLMHTAKDYGNLFAYQFLSLPLTVGQQVADAKIHLLTRKLNGKLLDPYNCYLYFHLTMPSLGELGIHVHVVEKMVSLMFMVRDGVTLELEDEDLSILRQGVQAAGYHLGTVRLEYVPEDVARKERIDPFSQLPIAVTNGNFDWKV